MNSFDSWYADCGIRDHYWPMQTAYLASLRRAVDKCAGLSPGIVNGNETAVLEHAFRLLRNAIESEASLIEGGTGEKT